MGALEDDDDDMGLEQSIMNTLAQHYISWPNGNFQSKLSPTKAKCFCKTIVGILCAFQWACMCAHRVACARPSTIVLISSNGHSVYVCVCVRL